MTVVTEANHVPFIGIVPQEARGLFQLWLNYKSSQKLFEIEGGNELEKAVQAMDNGVLVNRNKLEDVTASVAMNAIIGMYITKFDSEVDDKNDAWQKMQHEMMRIQVETARLQLNKLKQEDSWKQGDEE